MLSQRRLAQGGAKLWRGRVWTSHPMGGRLWERRGLGELPHKRRAQGEPPQRRQAQGEAEPGRQSLEGALWEGALQRRRALSRRWEALSPL